MQWPVQFCIFHWGWIVYQCVHHPKTFHGLGPPQPGFPGAAHFLLHEAKQIVSASAHKSHFSYHFTNVNNLHELAFSSILVEQKEDDWAALFKNVT